MNDNIEDAAPPTPPPAYLEEERLVGDAKRADDWKRILTSLINAILGWLIGKLPGGMGWRDPNPARAAFDARADEIARTPELDTPKEVFRIGRRIKLGAEIDGAKLSEPVLGALLTMSKPNLTALLLDNPIAIQRWTAVQQGCASPDPTKSYEQPAVTAPKQTLPRQRGTGFEAPAPAMR